MTARARGLGRALTARASDADERRTRLMAKAMEIEDGALSEFGARQRERAAWKEEKRIRAEIAASRRLENAGGPTSLPGHVQKQEGSNVVGG